MSSELAMLEKNHALELNQLQLTFECVERNLIPVNRLHLASWIRCVNGFRWRRSLLK